MSKTREEAVANIAEDLEATRDFYRGKVAKSIADLEKWQRLSSEAQASIEAFYEMTGTTTNDWEDIGE